MCLLAPCRWEAVQVFVGRLWVVLRSKWWTNEALQKTHRSKTLQMQPLWQVSVCVIRHSVSNRFWAVRNHFCFIVSGVFLVLIILRCTWSDTSECKSQRLAQIPKDLHRPQRPAQLVFYVSTECQYCRFCTLLVNVCFQLNMGNSVRSHAGDFWLVQFKL